MQHQRGFGHDLFDLAQKLLLQVGLEALRVNAVAGADGNGQRVDPGAIDKGAGLLRLGVADLGGGNATLKRLLGGADGAKLALDRNVQRAAEIHNALGHRNVFFKRQRGGVDHDRSEAVAHRTIDVLLLRMVKMDHAGDFCSVRNRLYTLNEVVTLKLQFAGVNGKDHGRLQGLAPFNHRI
ncbi:hypothetical protein SDC9_184752 [bioreactor metagenome]|uniref:Uncharacterized protein n=1 Tax=bioreactor metagenome TaxID=1076179 RepID=A0A645HF92_9ZZZZ